MSGKYYYLSEKQMRDYGAIVAEKCKVLNRSKTMARIAFKEWRKLNFSKK